MTKERKKSTRTVGEKTDSLSKKRGVESQYTDAQLRELALKVKNELKGQKLTYMELERRTGIGRNTWSRRIKDTIKELNTPPSRAFEITDKDEIYFPNIQLLFEIYGNNKKKIISELLQFEREFIEFFKQAKKYKEELERLEKFKVELEEKNQKIKNLKEKSDHYELLYKNVMVSSTFSHLREDLGIHNNLINFKNNIPEATKLDNLDQYFPVVATSEEIQNDDGADTIRQSNLNKLERIAPNIIKRLDSTKN